MHVQFATCNRKSALEFLKKLYPNYEIEDTGATAKVLDWVEKDVIRIPDPMMHGRRVAICPSTNFKEEYREKLTDDLKSFQEKPGRYKEVTK